MGYPTRYIQSVLEDLQLIRLFSDKITLSDVWGRGHLRGPITDFGRHCKKNFLYTVHYFLLDLWIHFEALSVSSGQLCVFWLVVRVFYVARKKSVCFVFVLPKFFPSSTCWHGSDEQGQCWHVQEIKAINCAFIWICILVVLHFLLVFVFVDMWKVWVWVQEIKAINCTGCPKKISNFNIHSESQNHCFD